METSNIDWEFETITKHTMDIILIIDKNHIIKFVTPSFEDILGYHVDEIIGTNAFDLVVKEDREQLIKSHAEALNSEGASTREYRVLHKNGEVKYFESSVMPVDHPEEFVVISIRDITIRKKIENELESRKNRYQVLQDRLKKYSQDISNVMNVFDLKHRLIEELNTILPNSEPHIISFNHEHQSVEGNCPSNWFETLPKLTAGKLEYQGEKVLILIGERKEQAYILSLNVSSIEEPMDSIWFETLVYYTIMVFESLNVIENLMMQLEKALEKNEKPQWILRLLFNLSEKQRLELSSDLHDTVLQEQLGLYRRLEDLLKEVEFPGETDEQLRSIVQGLLDTIHQIRMTCHELRPPLLKEIGLEKALENLFEHTQLSSTFKISYTAKDTSGLQLNEEKTIGIYRVVQELLNNAVKHSQATNLFFHMTSLDERLFLEYTDDGKGFEQNKLTPSFKSMGLSGIRERIQSLNGQIEFYSRQGEGVKAKIQIPI